MTQYKRLATREDWLLMCRLLDDPNTMMEDEYGKPAKPWQQRQTIQLNNLLEDLEWKPTLTEDASGHFGLWNQFQNCQMLACEYEDIGELPKIIPYGRDFEDFVPAMKRGKWGLVSSDGTEDVKLPFEYDSIRPNDAGFLLEKDKLFGLFYFPSGPSPEAVFDCKADAIWQDEQTSLELYRCKGKFGLVEPCTDEIFDDITADTDSLNDGQARVLVSLNGHKGYLSLDGTYIPKEESGNYTEEQLLHCWYFPEG